MPYSISLSPDVILDIEEAIDWYESKLSGLGDHFLEILDNRLKNLSNTPTSGSIRYDNIRCTMIEKFPYLIHYEIINNNIIVYRIFSTDRKPLWEK